MEIGALELHNRKHFLPKHRYEKIPGVTRGCAVYLVVGLLPTCGGYRMCSHMLHSLKQIEPKSQTRNELLFCYGEQNEARETSSYPITLAEKTKHYLIVSTFCLPRGNLVLKFS